MKEFEKKYGLEFEDFERQIKSAVKEDFEKWDDYIEWKAYSKSYLYWKSIHEESSQWLQPEPLHDENDILPSEDVSLADILMYIEKNINRSSPSFQL